MHLEATSGAARAKRGGIDDVDLPDADGAVDAADDVGARADGNESVGFVEEEEVQVDVAPAAPPELDRHRARVLWVQVDRLPVRDERARGADVLVPFGFGPRRRLVLPQPVAGLRLLVLGTPSAGSLALLHIIEEAQHVQDMLVEPLPRTLGVLQTTLPVLHDRPPRVVLAPLQHFQVRPCQLVHVHLFAPGRVATLVRGFGRRLVRGAGARHSPARRAESRQEVQRLVQ
mmetsp:Transcript_53635/g.164936  ORF Transcript_53635/g.164936 Transcript_53635/m.164936 type:complete len:230 (-) Transcript_53635:169-858(-)